MIYLDHAATSPILPCVKNAMFDAFENFSFNASSLYTAGHLAKNKIEEARTLVAKLINANPSEIIFTSGGSESNNSIIHTFESKTIAVSKIEHPSILEPAKAYAKKLFLLPVDEFGLLETSDLPKADLYSVMLANNELGTIEPLEKLKKEKPFKFLHSDLTQAIGKIPIDVKKLNLDYATFSAHKIGGPLGVGAIYVRTNAPFKPLVLGGHQENSLRAGTYNVPGIVGFGAAANYVLEKNTPKIYEEKIRPLRDELARLIIEKIPNSSLNTNLEKSLPNILNVSFAAAEGESIQLYLDLKGGICASTGSACAAGDIKPSHVIMSTKHNAEIAHSSIRFSLGLETTEDDVNSVMKILPEIIENLQSISTIRIKGAKND